MSGISAIIITYNEEQNIGRCLDSLSGVVDEIVVVDAYSTDQTVAICREKGARVVLHPFEGFVHQKNFALQQARHDWVLSLDADEALDERLRQSLLAVKPNLKAKAYRVNRLSNFCGQWIRHGAWYPDRKVRLWHRAYGQWGGTDPHDRVVLRQGTPIVNLPGHLLHYTATDLPTYRQHLKRFAVVAANAMKAEGRGPVLGIRLRAAWMFFRSFVMRRGFLDGKNGYLIARLIAGYTYEKYALLNQLHRSTGSVH
ncbi:MAG: glycosyltransferase family 2 protein [Chitinophagales bacterium]|nr:glycosyltransferase family 2 protein [Chitinophagales bacterium]MDW8393279.1 glycosyltransferase family 2 protein [Chitinophagales bacterium]